MQESIEKEVISIMKQLCPQNQTHFMSLLRVAAVAENAVKKARIKGSYSKKSPKRTLENAGNNRKDGCN